MDNGATVVLYDDVTDKKGKRGVKREIKKFKEVENIYDHGFWGNLMEICFPKKFPK